MIIQIRGTSGSGKSTAVRTILNLAVEEAALTGRLGPQRVMAEPGWDAKNPTKKRRAPLMYRFPLAGEAVSVIGSYENDCGGCDGLPNYETTFGLVRGEHSAGRHVIFEGLLLAHDKKQVTALAEWVNIRSQIAVIELTESLEACLDAVRARRAAKGASPDFNTENTVRRHKEVIHACKVLEERGLPVYRTSRAECVPKILELMGVKLAVAA